MDVDLVLAGCATKGVRLTRDELAALVAGSGKQRFALSVDGARIRANQGQPNPNYDLGRILPPISGLPAKTS